MVEVLKKEHNGVEYTNIRAKIPTVATSCVGEEKIILKGLPKVVIVKGSYKYDDEVQFSITNFKGIAKKSLRNNSNWDTIELCMPKEVCKELIKKLNEELNKSQEVKK